MTKEADWQPMNVAASRARDQMWCVRSVSPDELHPDDVRLRFIRYCQNPHRVDESMGDLAERSDSDFERDVLRHLLGRGYHVKVQHRVGRFRIGLVVEGHKGRLAFAPTLTGAANVSDFVRAQSSPLRGVSR